MKSKRPFLWVPADGKCFFRVTLPNIKWALLYGVILSNARAMGEFGAVSVVSGHIRGKTNTLPLHVEILYNEYNVAAAFAMASLLAMLGLVTLAIKTFLERQVRQEQELDQLLTKTVNNPQSYLSRHRQSVANDD